MRHVIALAAAIVAFGAAAAPAAADVYDVTTAVDGTGGVCPDDGVHRCTLRTAIGDASTNGNAIPDIINIPAGTYALNSALTTGTTSLNVTLQGAGADQTIIKGSGTDRVLSIDGEATYTLANLTLTGGRVAQGSGGDLLVGTAATGILDHVRISDGRATRGAGVANQGRLLAANASTFDANVATADGGGIANTNTGRTLLVNSTVAFNTAASGAGVSATSTSSAVLSQVTLARNTGGGLLTGTGTTYQVQGSILASNSGSNCAGTTKPADQGANVESGTDCGFSAAGDRQGKDPGLASALATDAGQTPTLALLPTSPAVDLAGACTGSDQRDVARPQGAACDSGAYELIPAVLPTPIPAPPPQPQPTPTPTPPAPVFHKQVVVQPVSGTVKVKLPGTNTFVTLSSAQDIPLGSTIDTKAGRIQLSSVPKANGKPQTATFFDGIFKVTQPGSITNLQLNEPLASCAKAHASKAKKKPKTRHLWGSGSGSFRTQGKYSAATVRGTEWLVEDTCAGTLTRVRHGVVNVRDNVRHKTIVVRAGHRYLARPRH